MNDRVRVAEAIGWIFEPSYYTPENGYWNSPCEHLSHYCEIGDVPPFNPFTDANDDYAVLEYYRHKWSFNVALNEKQLGSYEIGDFARAALKVIE